MHRIWKLLRVVSASSDKLRILSILIFHSKKSLTYSFVVYFVTTNLFLHPQFPDQTFSFETKLRVLILDVVVFVNNFICVRQNPWVKTIIWKFWIPHRRWWVRWTQESIIINWKHGFLFFNFVKYGDWQSFTTLISQIWLNVW